MSKNFTIYRSSAGSGKTYSLVRKYIAISLGNNKTKFKARYYRHILAITFTNKAANEMKSRIQSSLLDLSNGKGVEDLNSFFSHIKSDTGLSNDEIRFRSNEVLKSILHKYSDLSISTIDKFVFRIVKSFAFDLQLSQSFEVEMDLNKLIQPVVQLIISKIGDDEYLSKALISYSIHKLEDGKSFQLENNIEDFSKHLFFEKSTPFLKKLKKINSNDCFEIKDKLSRSNKDFESFLLKSREKFLSFCSNNNLNAKSFYRGTLYNYFTKLNSFTIDKLYPSKTILEGLENNRWYSKNSPKESKDIIDSNLSFLENLLGELIDYLDKNLKSYVLNKLVIRNIFSIAILNELTHEMDRYKEENNIKHISEFNKLISKIIQEEPSPFIYERLGERYRHFLIDEFQDTSVTQWHNLLPLIHNSLSEGNENLIVGDAKQSIYRWRGGEVEQFIQLPKNIFEDHLLPNSDEVIQLIKSNSVEHELNYNWRSHAEVVKFNNSFFEKISEVIDVGYDVYKGVSQKTSTEKKGYVKIDFSPKSDNTKEEILEKVLAQIHELKDLKYQYRDIALLFRTRKDAQQVADFLKNNDVEVISDEALLLSSSHDVDLIINVFKVISDPKDKVAISSIVNYVLNQNNSTDELNRYLKEVAQGMSLSKFLNDFNINFSPSSFWSLPLLDLVNQLMVTFNLSTNDIYLQFLSDLVHTYSLQKNNDLATFLEWWEQNKDNESIVLSDTTNAVSIMTVHKSKGLEFPVVIIPFDWDIAKPSSELWVNTKDKVDDLEVALIGNNKIVDFTDFSEDRNSEIKKALLDDINVLYVAFTRAKSQLYVFCSEPSKTNSKFNSLSMLLSYFLSNGELKSIYEFGEQEHHVQNIQRENVYKVDYLQTKNWKSKVQLKNSSSKLWSIDYDKQEWGSLLHNIFSEIHYSGQEDEVINRLQKNGLIDMQLKEKLISKVKEILCHEEFAPFFSKDYEVKTEKEILTKDGETYIPDRILLKNNKVTVIDFKTGSDYNIEEHKSQITTYSNLLSEMGYDKIKMVLAYTELEKTVVV